MIKVGGTASLVYDHSEALRYQFYVTKIGQSKNISCNLTTVFHSKKPCHHLVSIKPSAIYKEGRVNQSWAQIIQIHYTQDDDGNDNHPFMQCLCPLPVTAREHWHLQNPSFHSTTATIWSNLFIEKWQKWFSKWGDGPIWRSDNHFRCSPLGPDSFEFEYPVGLPSADGFGKKKTYTAT